MKLLPSATWILSTTVSLTLLSWLPLPASACSDRGGNYLSGYGKGNTLKEIVEGLNRGCPETIEINAGMNGLAVCDSRRVFLIDESRGRLGGKVVGIKKRGAWCGW